MVALVLMGAGASYGSVDVSPYPPPLGKKLFDKLEERGGIASMLPNHIKDAFRNDFEQGMAEFYAFSNGNTMAFQRELAHYLAEFCPGEDNLYKSLIDTLGTKRVIYSSLNYDLLFEISASLLGLNTSYSDEPREGCVRLLKPHGSCNFWPELNGITMQGCTFENNGVDINAPVKPLSQKKSIDQCLSQDSLSPAIALYAKGKSVRVCPDYVSEQQKKWEKTVKQARKIFVVGVRLHMLDEHIWEVLGSSRAQVFYCGSMSSKKDFDYWKAITQKKNAYFLESQFESAINLIKKRLKSF